MTSLVGSVPLSTRCFMACLVTPSLSAASVMVTNPGGAGSRLLPGPIPPPLLHLFMHFEQFRKRLTQPCGLSCFLCYLSVAAWPERHIFANRGCAEGS